MYEIYQIIFKLLTIHIHVIQSIILNTGIIITNTHNK